MCPVRPTFLSKYGSASWLFRGDDIHRCLRLRWTRSGPPGSWQNPWRWAWGMAMGGHGMPLPDEMNSKSLENEAIRSWWVNLWVNFSQKLTTTDMGMWKPSKLSNYIICLLWLFTFHVMTSIPSQEMHHNCDSFHHILVFVASKKNRLWRRLELHPAGWQGYSWSLSSLATWWWALAWVAWVPNKVER